VGGIMDALLSHYILRLRRLAGYVPFIAVAVSALLVAHVIDGRQMPSLSSQTDVDMDRPTNQRPVDLTALASDHPATLPSGRAFEQRLMRVTAYCPCRKCCGRSTDGLTASGHRIRFGDFFVAAPRELPFGTVIRIPGYGGGLPVQVLDRGNAVAADHLDVFFSNHQAALLWGVRYLSVTIEYSQPAVH
jgi:3D (Asp-Asp-Asp) domain-containing protein